MAEMDADRDIHKRIEGLPASVPGGVDNPLGARALLSLPGQAATRCSGIHGTNQPEYIGASILLGLHPHVQQDCRSILYSKVKQGTIGWCSTPSTATPVQFEDGAQAAAARWCSRDCSSRRIKTPALPAFFFVSCRADVGPADAKSAETTEGLRTRQERHSQPSAGRTAR
jgi:hypothetical protein